MLATCGTWSGNSGTDVKRKCAARWDGAVADGTARETREMKTAWNTMPAVGSTASTLTRASATASMQVEQQVSGAGRQRLFVSAKKAAQIDAQLMGEHYAFSLEQLMELAGQSVAQATADFVWRRGGAGGDPPRIVVACGPGNNGGDGLVAARHLQHFGFRTAIWYPLAAAPRKAHFGALLQQARAAGAAVHATAAGVGLCGADVVVDAVFGFSFDGRGGVREPFAAMLRAINGSGAPTVCVDVPSGWHVERGDVHDEAVRTGAALVSLSAPKLCAQLFERGGGAHYVGGRFVPPSLCAALDFDVVRFRRDACVARIA